MQPKKLSLLMMSRLLQRTFCKEVTTNAMSITLIVVVALLCNKLTHYLTVSAEGNLSGTDLIKVMGYEIPYLLSLLIPLGWFLGLVLTFGHWYQENQMLALFASGFSRRQVLTGCTAAIALASILSLVLCLWINPWVLQQREALLSQSGAQWLIQTVIPGRFRKSHDARTIFYVEDASRDRHSLKGIFVAQLVDDVEHGQVVNSHWVIVTGERGYEHEDAAKEQRYFVTEHGQRYDGIPGRRDFQIMQFERYGILLHGVVSKESQREKTLPLKTLWHLDSSLHPEFKAEIMWRFSLPLAVIVLSMLAVPLARIGPRQGRFSQFVPAFLLYLIYMNCLVLARIWLQKGIFLSIWPGFAIHVVFVVLAISMWFWQEYDWRAWWRQ